MHLWVSFITQSIRRITQAEICNIYSITRKMVLLQEKHQALISQVWEKQPLVVVSEEGM